MYLKSDKGVRVLFEFNGGPDDVVQSVDPILMTILPTSHFSTSYSLEGQGDFYNYIIVVAQNKHLDGIKMDPQPQTTTFNWRKVDGTDYSWAEMYYSTGANFYQMSYPDSPFGLYSYGVANANGYGSPAAANPAAIKEGTCWAMGDPHYRTFDSNYYNFMGSCTYTMAKNCQVDEDHPAFEVDAKNDKLDEFGLVRMNHTLWNLPINGKLKLSQSSMSCRAVLSGKVCGLCGNFNSKKEDDLVTPSGSQSSNVASLGKSWRVPNVYADACQRAGVKIHDWRHFAHCPLPSCPENSHYEFLRKGLPFHL
ncbi:hypothetical protein KUCAC02_011070 [Chaenocephalus aceratus]|uniref:Uncharacterized protein n=1 Tax=Chaenocephalus aceratus TaxID=36190 RepID=A0ACB9WWE7_CHAAC|nr:hypothetical protein KUCAC02_011070 [Chaenocephalus aceratus]